MPLERGGPKAPVNFGRFSFSRRLRRSAAAVLFVVALAHALPASAATMMAYCADSWCCFTSNHNAILAVAALILLIAGLFLFGGVALLLALAEAMADLATGAMFDLFPAAGEGSELAGEALEEAEILEAEEADSTVVTEGSGTLQTGNIPDANKLNHIFGKDAHNLGPLVERYGSETTSFNAIQEAVNQQLGVGGAGTFVVTVDVGGSNVTVVGAFVNGLPRIGTAYIPPVQLF